LPTKIERVIDEEQKHMVRTGREYMLEKKYFKMVSILLSPGEYAVIGARQWFPYALAPAVIVATNKRVLIVRMSFWTLYSGHNIWSPSSYVNIHYDRITEATLLNGRFFCTIVIKVLGSEANIDIRKLRKNEARRLIGFIERVTLAKDED
jgi:hypothetical protein